MPIVTIAFARVAFARVACVARLGRVARAARAASASLCATLLLAGLSGCGGGGGASASGGPVPLSGAYAWVLKAQGPTASLQYGLSLVHPSAPTIEYAVEYGTSLVSDARMISRGSVDIAGLKTGTLDPYALVYVAGGDVRRISLQANGTLPSTQVVRSHSNDVCGFLVDANESPLGDAIDYATPENSRLLVSTSGADGQCGTSDDKVAEVRLGDGGAISVNSISEAPLGLFRDSGNLAPRGWILGRTAIYWDTSNGTSYALRTSSQPAFTSLVVSTYRTALLDDGVQLSLVDFPAGATPVETRLDAALTGGGGWVAIGFDATSDYVYRNVGSGSGTHWSVLKVARGSPFAVELASGSGRISVASLGSTQLYATVLGSGGNALLAIAKAVGIPLKTMESTPNSTLATVQTSANGIHELWRVVNIGTAGVNYEVDIIDETGTQLYTTSVGGYPVTEPPAQAIDFTASEGRSRFIFANGYGSRAFGDATLMGYDTATKTLTRLGTLPGAADFGVSPVYANAIGGPAAWMAGFAARSSQGTIDDSGTKVFSFDFSAADSLRYTTTRQ